MLRLAAHLSAVARTGRACGQKTREQPHAHGIRARSKRRYKVTTDSRHGLSVAANLLVRQFRLERPNRAWTGDITCIATHEDWLRQSCIMDLHSRRVIGWSMSERIKRYLVMGAMHKFIGKGEQSRITVSSSTAPGQR